ncbi:MAG: hypothetical protein VB140_10770 [Burkholderia sp.]
MINMPVDAIASSRSIYATTPRRCHCVLALDLCNNAPVKCMPR